MKEVTSYKADNGRLFDTPQAALREDAVTEISHVAGITREAAEKVHAHWPKIHSVMNESSTLLEELLAK